MFGVNGRSSVRTQGLRLGRSPLVRKTGPAVMNSSIQVDCVNRSVACIEPYNCLEAPDNYNPNIPSIYKPVATILGAYDLVISTGITGLYI